MAGGGRREGAGRPKGARTVRSTKIVKEALASGRTTPLEVMLRAMDEHYKAERWDAASMIAKDAAPYMHPKLQSVMHTGDPEQPIVTDNTIRIEFVGDNDPDTDT